MVETAGASVSGTSGSGASSLEPFLLLAKGARGRAAASLVAEATAAPNVFTFGDLLDAPGVAELAGSAEFAGTHALLGLFCYGTLADYKAAAAAGGVPPLNAAQEHKLKQLTVASLAGSTKVLQYDMLSAQLGIENLRDLEDFLIECMYTGLIRGKLDQKRRCVEVHSALGRDVRRSELKGMIGALDGWMRNAQQVLTSIEQKINWATQEGEKHAQHLASVEARAEELTKTLKTEMEIRGQQDIADHGGLAMMDGLESTEERASGRSKRRR